jgi:predicted nucleic acid-binding protein
MALVSNTSPLCYLTLLGCVEVLPQLYTRIEITTTVLEELRHSAAPLVVRKFAATPPEWLRVHPDPLPVNQTLLALDPGERTALQLAEQLRANLILLDEAAARAFAVERGLQVAGTLGVLCDAADAGLLILPDALDRLRRTNFRASTALWKTLYSR